MALSVACMAPDLAMVTDGTCMASEVSDILVPACYDAQAASVAVTGDRKTQLTDAMAAIHTACTNATTQVCL